MKNNIIILLLIGFGSICSGQSQVNVKKTTSYINGVKTNKGGKFSSIYFELPYVYLYGTKSNNENLKITFKLDSSAGGILIGHDNMDEKTKVIINTEIPASAVIPTYSITLTKGTTTIKAILELEK
jgi:hypothetical protein